MADPVGNIIEIQRWSVADGPGSRTVVFLKGCPLHCPWCANPESQDISRQIGIFSSRCAGCGACERDCPEKTASPAREGTFKDTNCTACGTCIDSCHADARTWMGAKVTVHEIMDILQKDMIFYRKSGGGVTFSGGEPLTQPTFLKALIERCERVGIHTAVETCGYFSWQAAAKTVEMLDFIMFDIKHMDEAIHKQLTGVSNGKILENVKRIGRLDIPLVIRIPVIPTLNDSNKNIYATARFVQKHLPKVIGIEALPYHRLGTNKYAALGIKYQLSHIEPPHHEAMEKVRKIITDAGLPSITAENNYDAQLVHAGLKVAN